jgi:uncharacterized cupredoxin-like copper-binding protein
MRRRLVSVSGLVALAVIGAAVGALTPMSSASSKAHGSALITVTAKEFSFALSKKTVQVGTTVTFKVVNKGKISHNFSIAGKTTKMLNPGQSANLTVRFTKKGRVPFKCTLPGHAQAGMKGSFGVGVTPAPTPTPPPTTPKPPPPPPTTTTSGPVGTAQTTVTVNMVEYAFQLSQSSIPSGQITFVINNKGNQVHNFAIIGNKAGAQIAPGTSETWTVALPPGTYNYQCDVPFHADQGMVGQFTVTP